MSAHQVVMTQAAPMQSVQYWEERARKFAGAGEGLAAVCSYGMPEFYNRAIQLTQRLALKPWLRDVGGSRVLDVGCGVGRWSRYLAAQGASVTGVDLSATMVEEAARRARQEGVDHCCRFLAQDLAELDVGGQFHLIVGVTVLQHILDEDRLRSAVSRLGSHLAPTGRMVLIEAAPTRSNTRCDSPIFRARPLQGYLDIFADSGLAVEDMTGVDPTPLKTRFLPYYRNLPRPVAWVGLAAVTAFSLPVDAVFGRRWTDRSWHKVFVLKRSGGNGRA